MNTGGSTPSNHFEQISSFVTSGMTLKALPSAVEPNTIGGTRRPVLPNGRYWSGVIRIA